MQFVQRGGTIAVLPTTRSRLALNARWLVAVPVYWPRCSGAWSAKSSANASNSFEASA